MKSSNYKRYLGIGLSFLALTFGSVGLVGCETEGEVETEELEEEESTIDGEELEVEED